MQLGTVGIRRKVPNLIECAVMALVHVSLFLLSNIWFNLGKVPIELNIWGEGEIFHCSEEKNLLFQCKKLFFFRTASKLNYIFLCNLHYYGKLRFPNTFNVIKDDIVIFKNDIENYQDTH